MTFRIVSVKQIWMSSYYNPFTEEKIDIYQMKDILDQQSLASVVLNGFSWLLKQTTMVIVL